MFLDSYQILDTLREKKKDLRGLGVRRIALIGSFAKGEQTEQSDLDFLVEFENKSFENFMDLIFFLEDLFGRDVDLLTSESLREKVRAHVLEEAVYVPGL